MLKIKVQIFEQFPRIAWKTEEFSPFFDKGRNLGPGSHCLKATKFQSDEKGWKGFGFGGVAKWKMRWETLCFQTKEKNKSAIWVGKRLTGALKGAPKSILKNASGPAGWRYVSSFSLADAILLLALLNTSKVHCLELHCLTFRKFSQVKGNNGRGQWDFEVKCLQFCGVNVEFFGGGFREREW